MISRTKQKTPSTSGKKEKENDGYVSIYECGKLLFTSTFERACAAQETTISQRREIFESFNSDRKELRTVTQDLRNYIDTVKKERTVYP